MMLQIPPVKLPDIWINRPQMYLQYDAKFSEYDYMKHDFIEYSEEKQKKLLKCFASIGDEDSFIKCAEANEIDLTFEDNILMKCAISNIAYIIVKYLLDKNIDPNCCNHYPIKSICIQVYSSNDLKNAKMDIFKLLIEKGADINVDNYPIKCIVYLNSVEYLSILKHDVDIHKYDYITYDNIKYSQERQKSS